MNAVVLEALVGEIAPRIVGRRVTDVTAPARDCVLIRLGGERELTLGVSVTKALPLLYLAGHEIDVRGGTGAVAPGRAGDLKGATVVSLEVVPGVSLALLRASWTHQAGRSIERVLAVDLGRRPFVALVDAGTLSSRGPDPAGGRDREQDDARHAAGRSVEDPPSTPTVAWRHDDAGRLHVGLPPSNRIWENRASFPTWNDAALHAATELLPELVLERRRGDIRRVINRCLRRKRRALEKVRRELEDAGRADEYRRKAQLLLTRKQEIPRGVTPVTVLDYDGATKVEIDLDPGLTAARNAELLFGRARKSERKATRVPARGDEIEREIEGLESDLESAGDATPARLSKLEEKFHPPRAVEPRGSKGERARFRTYTVSGGWKVLVGKSNRDNDVLTHKIARPDDLWFHARQSPGSHVVLRREGGKAEPNAQAIREAAAIAAFHSKAGRSAGVPVCYTERRYVRKPRGGKPGLAVMSNEKVIFVDPVLPSTRADD